jgi:hypothetical protein
MVALWLNAKLRRASSKPRAHAGKRLLELGALETLHEIGDAERCEATDHALRKAS